MSPLNADNEKDNTPVRDTEYLLRRFPNEPDKYDFRLAIPRLSIFLPSLTDRDGLSFNREGEDFVTAEQMLAHATSENVRLRGGVVAVLSEKVREQDMSVRPSPADSPGHVVIPEMNRVDYDAKATDGSSPGKKKIKELADKLARMAQVRIAPKPKTKPTEE